MPAPDANNTKNRPVLGHVNLMADTLIANASTDDLRAIVRTLLATSPPTLATSFAAAARGRLRQSRSKTRSEPGIIFAQSGGLVLPTPELNSLLAYIRSLYGAGMGFDSIEILVKVVRATSGHRWPNEGELANTLAIIDADISQAIQSCREEVTKGQVLDITLARSSLDGLRKALEECETEVESWGGEFPFERGAANAGCLEF